MPWHHMVPGHLLLQHYLPPLQSTGATIQVTMTFIIFPNIYFSAPQQETGDSIACITHRGIINPHKNPDKFERQKYDKNIYIYKPYLCY